MTSRASQLPTGPPPVTLPFFPLWLTSRSLREGGWELLRPLVCEETEFLPPSPGGKDLQDFILGDRNACQKRRLPSCPLPDAGGMQKSESCGLGAVLEGLQICPVESKASVNMESDICPALAAEACACQGPGLRGLGRWGIA